MPHILPKTDFQFLWVVRCLAHFATLSIRSIQILLSICIKLFSFQSNFPSNKWKHCMFYIHPPVSKSYVTVSIIRKLYKVHLSLWLMLHEANIILRMLKFGSIFDHIRHFLTILRNSWTVELSYSLATALLYGFINSLAEVSINPLAKVIKMNLAMFINFYGWILMCSIAFVTLLCRMHS